jgi:hypothetical protein
VPPNVGDLQIMAINSDYKFLLAEISFIFQVCRVCQTQYDDFQNDDYDDLFFLPPPLGLIK